MPLGIKEVRKPIWQKKNTDSKKAALRFIQFEKYLYSDKMNNKRKRDKRIVEHDVNTNLNEADTDSNIEPPKKQQKNNPTHDKFDCKSELTENSTDDKLNCKFELIENRKKLETKNLSKKSKTIKKIKLNRTNDMKKKTKKNIKMKATTPSKRQVSERLDQCTLSAPTSESSASIKKIKKPVIEKTISTNNITHKKQVVALRNVSINFNNMV